MFIPIMKVLIILGYIYELIQFNCRYYSMDTYVSNIIYFFYFLVVKLFESLNVFKSNLLQIFSDSVN